MLETVRASGTKREAAERLGIHPGTIRTYMERMGLLCKDSKLRDLLP